MRRSREDLSQTNGTLQFHLLFVLKGCSCYTKHFYFQLTCYSVKNRKVFLSNINACNKSCTLNKTCPCIQEMHTITVVETLL